MPPTDFPRLRFSPLFLFLVLLGSVTAGSVTACDPPAATIVIDPPELTLTVGENSTIQGIVRSTSGETLSNTRLFWASADESVAIVRYDGIAVTVTGVGVGSTAIGARTADGVAATARVTVTPVPVARVAVTPATASITVGDTAQLTATPQSASGAALTGRTVTWSSLSTAVATVSSTGLVTAVAPGSATITATSEGQSGTASVTVTPVPTPTSAFVMTLEVPAGGQVQLPLGGIDAAPVDVTIDWGEGAPESCPTTWTTEQGVGTGGPLCTFTAAGTYTIRIGKGSGGGPWLTAFGAIGKMAGGRFREGCVLIRRSWSQEPCPRLLGDVGESDDAVQDSDDSHRHASDVQQC